ncbi:DUF262 domain-containing protein [Brachyspira pilosicoli]|uniref:DUF262 domain-containing protein n=1 Tax=Brachyspira pilosicoli TaxID=52584 RepID=UPI001C682247|nr:DUF262 domain-containing protein [Brachyspira pilosicoli]MBW5397744.1 DUF262 domain-containing protein [Brachyspira pilosicoli]
MNNNMIKSVTHLSLIELLSSNSNNNFYYSIPLYQRDYSWKKDNISEFINDIFEAYDAYINGYNNNYFFGSIITVVDEKDNNKHNVIDGQQRLTTFILFLKVIQKDFNKNCFSNITNYTEDEREIISELNIFLKNCLWAKKKEISKIMSEKSNDSSYIVDLLSDEDLNKIDDKILIYKNYNLLKEFYDDLKKEYSANFDIIKFINFVLSNIEFVKVETSSRSSALKIFSVLNTRGLELNSTDIIKAEMMYDLNINRHKDFESKWKLLEQKSSELNTSLESLFKYYITMYKPDSIKGTSDENIRELWRNRDKWGAIIEFENFISSYEYIMNMRNAYIWCLRHLLIMGKNAYTWIPLLITMKFKKYSDDDIMYIAKFLVKWHWLHLVNGYTIEKIKSFNFSILRVIKSDNNSIDEIIKLEPRVITHDGKTLEILSKGVCNTLRISNFYNLKWGRALLYFLFNKPLLETLENTIDIAFTPLKSTIEHIYPQNPKEDEWINCSEDFKHKLGNLTLLDKRSNIQASNDIDKKIKIYNNKLFMYTPELSKENLWSDEKIALRTEELIKDFCEYIDINYYN